jgi:hypothetical protein
LLETTLETRQPGQRVSSEGCREPARYLTCPQDPREGRYRSHQILRIGDTVSPPARPEARIAVADLFPR